jgi:hypothetical protein
LGYAEALPLRCCINRPQQNVRQFRDLAVVVGLIALGIVASAGSIWIIWQVVGIVP